MMLSIYLNLRCFAKNSKLAEARWSGLCSSVSTNTDSALSNWQQSVVIWCYEISQIKKTREIALCQIIKRRFNEKTRHKKVGYKFFYFVCDTAVRCARSFSDRTQCFNLASGLQPVLRSPVSNLWYSNCGFWSKISKEMNGQIRFCQNGPNFV